MSLTSLFDRAVDLWPRILTEAKQLTPFLPTYAHLLAAAIFPIYAGAHASLSAPSSAARKRKSKKGEDDDDEEEEEVEIKAADMEGLTPRDAILFPVLAGITLSSLYFLLTWLKDPAILNMLLNYYFMNVGVVMGTKFIKDSLTILRSFCFPTQYSKAGRLFRANNRKKRYESAVDGETAKLEVSPFPGVLQTIPLSTFISSNIWGLRSLVYTKCILNLRIHKLLKVKMPIDVLDLISCIAAIGLVLGNNYLGQKWYLSNIIGIAFCYGSGQYMSPTTFWTGTLILSALFFYDIYFVFFTPIMVTVATKLEVPIKLLFPRPSSEEEVSKGLQGLSMLGLGDIVIPGMMIALALRFDLYLHYLKQSKVVKGQTTKAEYSPVTGGWGETFWVNNSIAGSDLKAKRFAKPYFWAGMVGYVIGMATTVVVMQTTSHAQPALLYLVPSVLLSLWGTAGVKGELWHMWNFTEEGEEEKKKLEAEDKAKEPGVSADPEKEPIKDKSEEPPINLHSDETEKLKDAYHGREMTREASASTSDQPKDTDDKTKETAPAPADAKMESKPQNDTKAKSTPEKKISGEDEKPRHLIWFSIDFPREVKKGRKGPIKAKL